MSESTQAEAHGVGAQESLRRMILSFADSKRVLGIRYSDWLLGAPSLEMGIAASSMAQDEWGHARLLYAMLKDFGVDPAAVEHERRDEQYCSLDCLDVEFGDWAHFVAALVVVDGALTVALEGFSEGSFELAGTRIPKMLIEESFHRDLGAAWLRTLAQSEQARPILKSAVEAMLPSALSCLAPADASSNVLVEEGLMTSGEELRSRFSERVGGMLASIGIALDDFDGSIAGWDASRCRGPGHPDHETLERARGDRNRTLLVE